MQNAHEVLERPLSDPRPWRFRCHDYMSCSAGNEAIVFDNIEGFTKPSQEILYKIGKSASLI